MSGELSLDILSPTQSNKEVTINAALAELEAAVAGVLAVDLSAGNGTISALQAKRCSLVRLTGATVARTATFSPTKRLLVVENTGTHAVTLAVGSTTSSLDAATAVALYMDGTTNGLEVLAIGASGGGGGGGGTVTIGAHRYWMFDNIVSTTQNTDTPTTNTMELRASAGSAAQIPTAYGVHSDYYATSTAADKLFDGDDSTGCAFKYLSIRNFFTVDMGTAKAVQEIYVKSRSDGFNHQNWEVFDVLYSDDNKVFTKVCSIVTSDDGSTTASYTFTLPV